MATRIKLRRDTNANWGTNNPILQSGEIGIVIDSATDSEKLKIGDDVTPWNDLSFFSPGGISVIEWGGITGDILNQTDLQNLFDLKLNLSGGDMTGDLNMGGNSITGIANIDSVATGGTDEINIGPINANVVNIGRSGEAVNILTNLNMMANDITDVAGIKIEAGTLADNENALSITATMPTTAAAVNNAINIEIASAGNSSFNNRAVLVQYKEGYTGISPTIGAEVTNSAASTGSDITTTNGNNAILGNCNGTTTGSNTGGRFISQNANLNIGVIGLSITAKNNAINGGGVFIGRNTGTTPIEFGVYAGLSASGPTLVSAALIADNSNSTSPIALFRDNGITMWSITDGGTLNAADGRNIAVGINAGTRIGTSTSQKIGFWNATPIVQPSSTGETSGFTAGSGSAVNNGSTFTGNVGTRAYTIGDIVKHLKSAGILAS
jgi:hypothetical protein